MDACAPRPAPIPRSCCKNHSPCTARHIVSLSRRQKEGEGGWPPSWRFLCPRNLRRAQRRICRRTQPPRVRTQDMEPLPPCRREFARFRRREAEDDREELREARPAEGGEQEGGGGDHGGQAPGLVEVRNLEAVGTGSREAREPGEAGQEEQPAQAAIGDPEPREEPQRAQRHPCTYSQLLLMEYVFQHTGYPSTALRQELAGIVDVSEATVQTSSLALAVADCLFMQQKDPHAEMAERI
ncbi:Alx Homeobox Protein 1 [Manis pentadactyla]|nr:Alx Homeobox Protein 1 [Manis pentadactyla]